eukprot:572214-Pleurochrysis_carterae.AAC.2
MHHCGAREARCGWTRRAGPARGTDEAGCKLVVDDPVTALRMSLSVRGNRLRCPAGKRELVMSAFAEARTEAMRHGRVRWKQACSLVGKLANIAQVLPELKRYEAGAAWRLRGGTGAAPEQEEGRMAPRIGEWRQLRRGGRAEEDWEAGAVRGSRTTTDSERGWAPLAPQRCFTPLDAEGTLALTTDASGIEEQARGGSQGRGMRENVNAAHARRLGSAAA